jgi:hypothetical protein
VYTSGIAGQVKKSNTRMVGKLQKGGKRDQKMWHCLLLLASSSYVSVATAQSLGAFYNPDFTGGVGCGVVDLGSVTTTAAYRTSLSTLLVSFANLQTDFRTALTLPLIPFANLPVHAQVGVPTRKLTRHTIRSCPTAQTQLWKRHVRMRRHRPPTAQEVPSCSSIFL